MGNSAGLFGVVAALFRPGLVVPHVIVPDISHLNWINLKEAGVSHVVLDKDNCITLSLQDSIISTLKPSWEKCTRMGFNTILIVSNSAGSSNDPLGIGAEHLSRQLGQLVLAHPSKKPANACAKQIISFLSQRQEAEVQQQQVRPGHILVVGDRITTDIILASRMQRQLEKKQRGLSEAQKVIGVLTTSVHSPERLGTRLMRGLEMWVLGRLVRMGVTPGSGWRSKRDSTALPTDWQSIATDLPTLSTSASISEIAEEGPSATTSIADGVRALPSRMSGSLFLAGSRSLAWLGAGWHILNDGIQLGTKGYIGSPDPSLRRTRMQSALDVSKTPSLLSSSVSPYSKIGNRTPPSHRPFSSQHRPSLPPAAGRRRVRGWPSAMAAVILLPSCWYGGVMLHEWMDSGEGQGEEQKVKEPPAVQQSRPASIPPSLASPTLRDETLLSTAYHLRRELEDIDEKIERLEDRSRNRRQAAER